MFKVSNEASDLCLRREFVEATKHMNMACHAWLDDGQ